MSSRQQSAAGVQPSLGQIWHCQAASQLLLTAQLQRQPPLHLLPPLQQLLLTMMQQQQQQMRLLVLPAEVAVSASVSTRLSLCPLLAAPAGSFHGS
jgi:hypothetical protein